MEFRKVFVGKENVKKMFPSSEPIFCVKSPTLTKFFPTFKKAKRFLFTVPDADLIILSDKPFHVSFR